MRVFLYLKNEIFKKNFKKNDLNQVLNHSIVLQRRPFY